jgi:NADPH:quinone reductase-like Zn-dependent oxidoreductase
MKAYVYAERIALDALQLVERPDPVPGPYDVVLKMRAAALNYRDLAIARGHYHIGVSAPLIPLSDGAGEVIALGSKVRRVRIGDLACPVYLPDWIEGPVGPRVARRRLGGPSDGVLSELMCLNEDDLVRAPAHLEAAEAACLPVTAVTAWHFLYEVGTIAPGETVLVQGSGGVSTAAIQLAHAGGARVVAVIRGNRHEQKLRELGAADVVTTGDGDNWPARAVELTGGEGADVAVNVAGGPTLAQSIAATRVGGKVHLVGYAAGTSASIDIFEAIRRAITLHVATAGSRRNFESLIRALELRAIRPVVARSFAVEEIGEAFAHLAAGRLCGKVVLVF